VKWKPPDGGDPYMRFKNGTWDSRMSCKILWNSICGSLWGHAQLQFSNPIITVLLSECLDCSSVTWCSTCCAWCIYRTKTSDVYKWVSKIVQIDKHQLQIICCWQITCAEQVSCIYYFEILLLSSCKQHLALPESYYLFVTQHQVAAEHEDKARMGSH
jgi:hypothetical protein